MFKPSTDSVSFLVSIGKNVFQFCVWGYLWVTSQLGVFSYFWPSLSGPGRQPIGPFFILFMLGVGVGNFKKVGYFTSDSATLVS